MPRKERYNKDKKLSEQYRLSTDGESFTEYRKRIRRLKREGLL